MGEINDFVAIDAAGSLSIGLRADGTVLAWGAFGFDGGPAFVPEGLSGVSAIAAASTHCLAVKEDGTVLAWGVPHAGALDVPSGLVNVATVAAGAGHNLALKGDGTVVAWGDNAGGACDVPHGLGDVVAVSVRGKHSVAIRSDGTPVVWGDNGDGIEDVDGLVGVRAIVGNTALLRDGTVLTVGGHDSNTYGYGTVEAPDGLTDVVAVAGDGIRRFGLRATGTVVSWGFADTDILPPEGLVDVTAIAAGGNHVLALKRNGTVQAWGANYHGQTDVPTLESLAQPLLARQVYPSALVDDQAPRRFIAVAAGSEHSMALRNDGTVVAWGGNSRGQLDVPEGLTGVIAIAAGHLHSIALLSDGTVVTWGGTVGGPITQPPELRGVTAIAAGGSKNLAICDDGALFVWEQGFGRAQDLPPGWADILVAGLQVMAFGADPIALRRDGEVLVTGWGRQPPPSRLTQVTSLTGSASTSYALRRDGTVATWGREEDFLAELAYADGRKVRYPNPVNVKAVAAGVNHALALRSDGTVAAWGYNNYQKATPPAGLSDIVAVAVGVDHSLALTSDGTIHGWGSNKDGQLEAPKPDADGSDTSASRVIRELTLRMSRLRGDLRLWEFQLSEAGGTAPSAWYSYYRRGERNVEDDPGFTPEIADGFYKHLAQSLLEQSLPSVRMESGVSVSMHDSADKNFPIALTSKVSIRKHDLAQFLDKEATRTALAKTPRTTSDIDLHRDIYTDFPVGWKSPTDVMEGFILIAALELQVRRRMSPRNPWDAALLQELPPRFRFDPLGSLLRWGPNVSREWHGDFGFGGEQIGRLPLWGIVWKYTAEVLDEFRSLRAQGAELSYYTALARLDGVVLGKYGLALFQEAFRRSWFDSQQPSLLTPVEVDFLTGKPIVGSGGHGILNPDGSLYEQSLWNTAFRLVERRSPEHYISTLRHRLDAVNDILDRGAEFGLAGARHVWPGWSEASQLETPPRRTASESVGSGDESNPRVGRPEIDRDQAEVAAPIGPDVPSPTPVPDIRGVSREVYSGRGTSDEARDAEVEEFIREIISDGDHDAEVEEFIRESISDGDHDAAVDEFLDLDGDDPWGLGYDWLTDDPDGEDFPDPVLARNVMLQYSVRGAGARVRDPDTGATPTAPTSASEPHGQAEEQANVGSRVVPIVIFGILFIVLGILAYLILLVLGVLG